jgi:hypothetical protein
MTSPVATRDLREVWVFGPGDFREAIGECGLCLPGEAESQAAALRTWLRTGLWRDGALDPHLIQYRSWLRSEGIDPTACRVRVLPVAELGAGLNGVREPEPVLA